MSGTNSSPDTTPQAAGSRRIWLLSAVVVAVLVVVVAIFWTAGGNDADDASGGPGSQDNVPGSSLQPSPGQSGSPGLPGSEVPTAVPTDEKANPRKQRVRFDQTATPTPGVDLEVAQVEAVTGKAEITGEVGGPALRITVRVTNRTKKPVAIETAVTNLYYGRDRRPASPILRPGTKPLPPSVAPGDSVEGRVVYTIPKNDRSVLLLEVNLDNTFRTVLFNGSCPRDC